MSVGGEGVSTDVKPPWGTRYRQIKIGNIHFSRVAMRLFPLIRTGEC